MTAPVLDAGPLIDLVKQAITATGVLFDEGKKPVGVTNQPYIVGFFDAGTISDRTLRSRDGFSVYASFQCAGREPESARFAVTKLRRAVLGLAGTAIGDRRVHMPSHEATVIQDPNYNADPVLFIQIDEWRLRIS